MDNKILKFSTISCGYYFEVEKISEVDTVPNFIKKYPCCEVVNMPRKSILNFYKNNDETSFEYTNDKEGEIQVIAFKKELDFIDVPTETDVFINIGEQMERNEFKNIVETMR